MNNELEFKDKSGRNVHPGDLIVYGVSYGHSPGLSYGKVQAIVKAKRSYPEGLIKIRVHGADRHFSDRVRVNTKPGVLQFSERVLLVSREQVPADILAELDKLEPVFVPGCTCESWYCGHARECPQYGEAT